MNKNKIKKVSRRTLSLAMLAAFTITLSGCSSNTNEYGNLDRDAIYSQAGANYTVTNGELWDELKWSAVNSLTNQISNVVINDEINKIKVIMKNNYSGLTTDEAGLFESEEEYNELYTRTKTKLVDYVVQDIYNFTYRSDDYWDSLDSLLKDDARKLEEQYIDDMYLATKQTKVDDKEISDLIRNAGKNNFDNYFTIAQAFPGIYYPSLAKENFALSKLQEEVATDHESDDETSDIYGKYTKSQFASKYKSIYANQFDLNLVLIRFSSETEYNNTLRAFGLKVYNRNLYYIPGTSDMTYDQYVKHYNDYTITANDSGVVNITNNSNIAAVLQLYTEMYNYVYGGYRGALTTGQTLHTTVESLNDLRDVTQEIIDTIGNAPDDVIDSMIKNLSKSRETTYKREDLDNISTTFTTYLYETLLEDDPDDDVSTLPYSTASQNYNDSYYIAYKFGEGEYSTDGLNHKELYNKDMTNDDIFDMLKENKLLDSIEFELMLDDLNETLLDNYISEAVGNVNVKIYNEAIEIGYLVSNSEYSRTLSGLDDKNVLATITYNDRTWNFNLKANENDSSSLLVAGTDEIYGVFDELEASDGITTAIDILSNKIVKNTKAYADTNEDRDVYEDYIEAILYNFSNNSYSSSGYSSSIGKYNFMMLYFHDVNIDNIIDNFYRVSSASSQLLTDYSSNELVSLFKTYTDISYNNYFSMSGTRLVVYYDENDDNEADETTDWKEKSVEFNFGTNTNVPTTLGSVAKYLILEINNELSASTSSHATALSEIVTEINESGKVAYDRNPILSENTWAKYRYLGLNVMTEDYSCTNSSTDLDYTLKQRLYDYALGSGNVIINGTSTKVDYQYYINDATPSEYIQPYDTNYSASADILSLTNTEIVETTDGYNLIIVSSGSTKSSAEWTKEDNNEGLLEDIVIKYNDEKITISDIYNEEDKLNENQIKLYVLEYVTSQTSNLIPSSISDAITNYLSPVYERYTADATQRIILLYFIEQYAGSSITFTDSTKNAELAQIIKINKNIADDYSYIYEDTTNTSNNFTGWWTDLEKHISNLIIKDGE